MLEKAETVTRIANWRDLTDRKMLTDIRHHVFIDEQNVPESLEWDEFDASATHFLVLYNEQAIATARLKSDGQVGRMAVLPNYRNQGIGSALLQFVLNETDDQKINKVYLHAQTNAIKFYEKMGFNCQGKIFYEANIPHRVMIKT